MQLGLKDKVALVVGAANGVGVAIARRLAAQEAKLVVVDRPEAMPALTAEFDGAGDTVLAIAADTTQAQAVRACVDQANRRFGAIHILVNALPGPAGLGLDALSRESFTAAISDTLGVQFAFLREVVPQMRRQGYGRVVNLSSLGYLGLPGGADVAAAQSGTFGLCRSLALECAKDQVTVNTVVCGDVTTPGQSEEDVAKLTASVPAKRLATVSDIAFAVNFFASDASKYVTGQTFFVCGGKSAYFSMSV